MKEGLILPGRVRACPEIFARILREEDYAASVVRRRTVTKGPGKDRTGGVAIRLTRYAKLFSLLKHRAFFHPAKAFHGGKRHGYFLRPAEWLAASPVHNGLQH
jgi:hypothetical protein